MINSEKHTHRFCVAPMLDWTCVLIFIFFISNLKVFYFSDVHLACMVSISGPIIITQCDGGLHFL